jgi:hypothetical protein
VAQTYVREKLIFFFLLSKVNPKAEKSCAVVRIRTRVDAVYDESLTNRLTNTLKMQQFGAHYPGVRRQLANVGNTPSRCTQLVA